MFEGRRGTVRVVCHSTGSSKGPWNVLGEFKQAKVKFVSFDQLSSIRNAILMFPRNLRLIQRL